MIPINGHPDHKTEIQPINIVKAYCPFIHEEEAIIKKLMMTADGKRAVEQYRIPDENNMKINVNAPVVVPNFRYTEEMKDASETAVIVPSRILTP